MMTGPGYMEDGPAPSSALNTACPGYCSPCGNLCCLTGDTHEHAGKLSLGGGAKTCFTTALCTAGDICIL
jgi:hypothetical protein